MIMIQIRKKDTKSTAVKAGIAGVVIGAAGTAIGIAMSDKKNREKVKKSLGDAKQWTDDKMSSVQKNSKDASESVRDDAKKVKVKVASSENLK